MAAKRVLIETFNAAILRSLPGSAVRGAMRVDVANCGVGLLEPDGQPSAKLDGVDHVALLAVGKAAVDMACAAADSLKPLWAEMGVGGRALVITKHGHAPQSQVESLREAMQPCIGSGGSVVEVQEASHPVPDASSLRAGQSALEFVAALPPGPTTLLLCLVSGGGSSLLEAPVAGVSLADISATTGALLASGAPIQDMNCVRRLLSRVKGGGVLRAVAEGVGVATLLLSDVVGDDPATIASGPTVPAPLDRAAELRRCRAILGRARLAERLPPAVRECLCSGAIGAGAGGSAEEAAGPATGRSLGAVVVASNAAACSAALGAAGAIGAEGLLLSTTVEGEAAEVAAWLGRGLKAAQALRWPRRADAPATPPADAGPSWLAPLLAVGPSAGAAPARPLLVVLGGETTVTLQGAASVGRGGRNQEFALAMARELSGCAGISVLSGGTDGTDGPTDAAGGVVDGSTWEAIGSARAQRSLAGHDAYPALAAVPDTLVKTGPTGTNVMDVVLCLVEPPA